MLRLIHALRNAMIHRPLPHLLIVPAHPRAAIIRPWVAVIERKPERKHIRITLAHDKLPQRINTVIKMPVQVLRLRSRISAQLRIMRFPVRLSEEI